MTITALLMMERWGYKFIFILLWVCVGCQPADKSANNVPEALQKHRADIDFYFKKNVSSPYYQKGDFKGIAYFDYAPDWELLCTFIPEPTIKIARLTNTQGSTDEYRIMGQVVIAHAKATDTLTVFRMLRDEKGKWFLPFADLTNGKETYEGGRYLELEPANSNHQIKVDFNYAYHPMCVHDSTVSCPLVPSQNSISAPIYAGERLP